MRKWMAVRKVCSTASHVPRAGLTSTTSNEVTRQAFATRWPRVSRSSPFIPSGTGTPVAGANAGSTLSMSKLTWRGRLTIPHCADNLRGDVGHAALAYLCHVEDLDFQQSHQVLLKGVKISDAEIDGSLRIQASSQPGETPLSQAVDIHEYGQRHALNVSGERGLRQVQISMCVDPQNIAFRKFRTERPDGGDGHGMIAPPIQNGLI
jgi:hypothetical protein